ncbi:MAG TPA: carboxypeptidase regulatory-like domain-containing protein, partial [Polyangiaceae bacterium]|nr:carboxypeptidase regulatory-like domain-containing protein [Polyangiaceae bacterium]
QLDPQPGAAPAPAAPAPAAPAPVAPGDPLPPPAQPPAAPADTLREPDFSAGGQVNFGGAAGSASTAVPPAIAEPDERRLSLRVQNSLSGSTGLLHLSEAGSGAAGTFRMSLVGSYFGGSEFLCSGSDCPTPGSGDLGSDEVSRVGVHVGLSATLLPFLEASFGFHSYATSNDRGDPELLQALGDTNFGLKAFMPRVAGRLFSFGGEAQLWFLNGSGSVGLEGSATSFELRGLATLDLQNQLEPQSRIPLRVHANLGYFFDNSGAVVNDIEERQNTRISRIERFGLNISRTDALEIGFGVDGTFEVVRPFLEWSIDVPVNRQEYTCNAAAADTRGDKCLGDDASLATVPSRLSVGARLYPWNENLALLAAVDIGTGATYDFLEEVTPELPWNLYFGVAYAVDTKPNPIIQQVEVEKPTTAPAEAERYLNGVVIEKGTNLPISGASVRFDGRNLTGLITAEDGTFRTPNLDAGSYTLNVAAPGYRAAQCPVLIPASGPGTENPYTNPYGESQPNPPAAPAGAPPTPVPPGGQVTRTLTGGIVVTVQCQLESLPKVGNVVGSVVDAERNAPVAQAKVKITDKLNRELELIADGAGAFRFENVPPGPVRITVEAPGYLTSVTELEIQPREDVKARIALNKRPAQPNVVVTPNELRLKKQVHFQHDSAEILPDSASILEELADVLKKRADIQSVEVQGHTDNTGNAAYNMRLSQERA